MMLSARTQALWKYLKASDLNDLQTLQVYQRRKNAPLQMLGSPNKLYLPIYEIIVKFFCKLILHAVNDVFPNAEL
jgi:hypothetical protein